MTKSRLTAALLLPLTDAVILIAIGFFAVLAVIVREAGILGLWLAVILVPALFRYLLMLLDARSRGVPTPVATLEAFNVADSAWTLAPLVLIAVAVWGSCLLHQQVSAWAGWLFAAALVLALPASLAVLAVTRSPWTSLDPRAVGRMIVACGPAYALVPAALVIAVLAVDLLRFAGLPFFVTAATACYAMFFVVTYLGVLLHEKNIPLAASIPDPLEPDLTTVTERRLHSRRQVLTHAYGFFTRDNHAGGLLHIRDALRGEADEDEALRWYLAEMFKWESKGAALALAQTYLTTLLDENRDVEAVKLMSRGLLENPRFRPLPADRDAALSVARRLDRDDLVRAMELGEASR